MKTARAVREADRMSRRMILRGGAILCLLSRLVNILRLRGLNGHRSNVRRSRKVLTTVRSFSEPGRAARSLAYLRQVEPQIFEEIIMSALEDAGALVLRSRRYSGDEGVDGAFWNPDLGWYAVQVKRYSGHVNRQHISEFSDVVRRSWYAGGVFVHTGRSGAGVYEFLPGSGIILLSGERLVQLIQDRGFRNGG